MESLLKQNSQTSKKPESTGALGSKRSESKNSQERSEKRSGGQKGRCGSTLVMSKSPDEIVIEMSQLLHEMKKYVDDVRKLNNKIEEETIEAFKQKYDSILMKGFEVNPPPKNLEVYTDKRGVQAQSKAKNLLDRLAKYKNEVLRFATDVRVPFGNNQAERDLRMITVQQNISGSFRTPHGADAFCRIRGFISTMMKNNMPVISSLYAVFDSRFKDRVKTISANSTSTNYT